tara:strand:- start:53 stop:238 length:186 start_codon:yes stop_codon:yes gene_type:complete
MENFYNNLDTYLLVYASVIAGGMFLMLVFTIVDYIKFMIPYWNIEKKYKRELNQLRKNGSL